MSAARLNVISSLFRRFYKVEEPDVFQYLLSLDQQQLKAVADDLKFVSDQVQDMVNYHKDMKEENDNVAA